MRLSRQSFSLIIVLALAAFFAALFLSLTMPIVEPDFWWHLATGRWMWDNGSLMHTDPFTFTADPLHPPPEGDFIFTQYWLAQLLFYGVYLAAGFKGIIILRALVFTLFFYLLFRLMRKAGPGYLPALALLYLSVRVIVGEIQYIGDKPQMWSSLFTVVLICLLELMRANSTWACIALPALMVVWSNMHGGFILGCLIILIYLGVALIGRTGTRRFHLSAGLALLLSGLNPNGFQAFHFALPYLTGLSRHGGSQFTLVEGQSIFQHAPGLAAIPAILPHLTAFFVLFLAAFLINIRHVREMRRELLAACFLGAVMGAIAIRFIIFFIVMACIFTIANLDMFHRRQRAPRRVPFSPATRGAILSAATLLLLVAAAAQSAIAGLRSTALGSARPYDTDYAGVVNFMRQHQLRGKLFNDFNPGGYLIWWLAPEVKLFIDSRAPDPAIAELFETMSNNPLASSQGRDNFAPMYRKVLDDYHVNLVAFPGCGSVTGMLISLAVALARDQGWAVVYVDSQVILFMRELPETRAFISTFALPKAAIYDNVIALAKAASISEHGQRMPYWRYSLAFAHYQKGDVDTALLYLNDYLRFVPSDVNARQIRDQLAGEVSRKQRR